MHSHVLRKTTQTQQPKTLPNYSNVLIVETVEVKKPRFVKDISLLSMCDGVFCCLSWQDFLI